MYERAAHWVRAIQRCRGRESNGIKTQSRTAKRFPKPASLKDTLTKSIANFNNPEILFLTHIKSMRIWVNFGFS